MKSKTEAPANYIYPMPLGIIATDDSDGKPNVMVVAYIAPLNHEPPIISVSMAKTHFTNPCIEERGVFSVNIPSRAMIAAVDFAGSVSAADTDKSTLFKMDRGELGAPLVSSCPISLECRLQQTLEYEYNKAYIAQIVNAYVDDSVMAEGLPDMAKVDPLLFSMHNWQYFSLGEMLGQVWSLAPTFQPVAEGV
jgi:flavin reductase (DIM6/NTAB) family NADH-FMN oxidoreductase RutF